MKYSLIPLALAACVQVPAPDPNDPMNDTTVEPTQSSLAIAPIAQQTPVWCWLASAEMIFRHYQVPALNQQSYQCGIIAAAAGPQSPCWYDCTQCIVGSGTDARAAEIISYYPQVVQQLAPQYRIPQLQSSLTGPISAAAIQHEIDAGDPIELGVTPSGPFQGMAGHAVVIVGYDATTPGAFFIDVNDPFPYDTAVGPAMNPWRIIGATSRQPGQYRIEYGQLAQLQWSATIRVEPR